MSGDDAVSERMGSVTPSSYVCNKMNDPGLKRVRARLHVVLLVVIEGTPIYVSTLFVTARSVDHYYYSRSLAATPPFDFGNSHVYPTIQLIQLIQL